MDRFAIPETAIAAFERVHDVLITLHDFNGRLQPRLAVTRSYHRHPLCHAAKARDQGHACLAFDQADLHALAPLRPDGFVQRCHAGLVEVVVPLRHHGAVVGVLNAGPRGEGSLGGVLGRTAPRTPGIPAPRLPGWTPEQALTVLESLRQLASRLAAWLEEVDGDRTITARDRRGRILHLVRQRAQHGLTLGQLAAELRLSVDRAGHVVREEFAMSFLDLLASHRLEQAAAMLGSSDLPIATVAGHCGFGDLSAFHRRFRARFGLTPARYRTQRQPPHGPAAEV